MGASILVGHVPHDLSMVVGRIGSLNSPKQVVHALNTAALDGRRLGNCTRTNHFPRDLYFRNLCDRIDP